MGDIVELIDTVKERFGVYFSDVEAEAATTPEKLLHVLMTHLYADTSSQCLTQRAFYILRQGAVKTFNAEEKLLLPHTSLREIVPKGGRAVAWERFRSAVGAKDWPELKRPASLVSALSVLVVLSVVGVAYLMHRNGLSLTASAAGGCAVGVLVGWGAALSTRRCKTAFSNGYSSMADLAHYLVAHNPQLLAPKGHEESWTQERVWSILREIILQHMRGRPFSQESSFWDLGID